MSQLRCLAQVSMSRVLAAEAGRQPDHQTKATRVTVMRLACDGQVDKRLSAAIWEKMPPTLMDEAVSSILGRMSSIKYP